VSYIKLSSKLMQILNLNYIHVNGVNRVRSSNSYLHLNNKKIMPLVVLRQFTLQFNF